MSSTQVILQIAKIATVTLFLGTCSSPPAEPPRRPGNVPANAFWVGGPDGGVFIHLQRSPETKQQPRVYDAQIYNDGSGDLWYSGKLVLTGNLHPEPNIAEPETFLGWDGERLHLADGRTMESLTSGRTTPK